MSDPSISRQSTIQCGVWCAVLSRNRDISKQKIYYVLMAVCFSVKEIAIGKEFMIPRSSRQSLVDAKGPVRQYPTRHRPPRHDAQGRAAAANKTPARYRIFVG